MEPLVSVIMPAYNAQRYIGEAIESILNQTYHNLELIIIEDCSQDETYRVAKQYAEVDARVKLHRNECNKGIAFSTNRGIALSQGNYIALLDDDDVAAQERLQLQVSYLENHSDIDILGGRSQIIDSEGNVLRKSVEPRYNPKYLKAMLLFNNVNFFNGTTMIRKEFIDRNSLCYQEECLGMQDYKFFIDSSKVGRLSSIDSILLYYRLHDDNETKRRMDNHGELRKQKYAEFQRESIKKSGFCLTEEQLEIINKLLPEQRRDCETREDLTQLYDVFREMIAQAKAMQVDYYDELVMYCKRLLSQKIERMIVFDV